jgi:hypothetical protein
MSTQQEYQGAANLYASQLRELYSPPEALAESKTVTRSAATLSPELLAERAEKIAESSEIIGNITADYLQSGNQAQREAAEVKLLAQAIAELELVQELLEQAKAAEEDGSDRITRSALRSGGAINDLIDVLETPIDAGIPLALMKDVKVRGIEQRPKDLEQAKADLAKEVLSSLSAICEQTSDVGWKAATNLVLMDGAALKQGLEFISKDAAHLIDEIVAGVGNLMLRLVKTAIRLLAQVYNWIQALLGKEIEEEARQQIGKWLEDLKKEQPDGKFAEGFFGQIVTKIYTPSAIERDVKTWLETTQVEVGQINQTAEVVENLAKKHEVRAKQVDRLLTVIAFVKKIPAIKTPQGQVISAAVLLGVLAYTIYSGYDHIRDGRIVLNEKFSFNIPDRVVGVRETVQQALGAVEPPASPVATS